MKSHHPEFHMVVGFLNCLMLGIVCASPTVEDLNEALGVAFFTDESLWDDGAEGVANRLGWPQASQTSVASRYRKYSSAEDRVLGCRPYSLLLTAEGGKPTNLSMVFANKGDGVATAGGKGRGANRGNKSYKRAIAEDQRRLMARLTELFGEPVADRFGQGHKTQESIKRWDWKGHAFLLASPRDEYVTLRIMTSESADVGGKSRIPDSVLREAIAKRVERRINGDVILQDIPMVNQGPKGYCVPATWERVMRYMGIPADMYTLAMAGQTEAGGGTSVAAMSAGASQAITRAGRRIESPVMRLDATSVSRFIDRGLPIMWTMFSSPDFNNAISSRVEARKATGDTAAWKKVLADARRQVRKIRPHRDSSHICIITGYNKQTGEIAISDSWGVEFAERWITPEEAAAVSQTSAHTIINF